jgi:hypothetical protein
MSFLTPLFLLGALALAGPILFHLIRRTPRNRVPFSSLRFLEPTPPRITRRSRIEHWLLLLLRCLALALVAFGFARPFLRQPTPPPPPSGPASRTLLLVDTSASMRRPDLFNLARKQVAERLRNADPGEQFALFTFDREVTQRFSFDQWSAASPQLRPTLAAASLDPVQPSSHSTRLGPALIRAAEELSAILDDNPDTRRRIVVISDLQDGARLDPLQSFEWPRGVEVVPDPVRPTQPGNASLQLLPDPPDSSASEEPVVRLRIANSSDASSEQLSVGWANPDNSGFAFPPLSIYVPPGQGRIVALPIPTNSAGLQRILLRGDVAPFDNTLFVQPPQPVPLHLVYLGEDAATEARKPLFFLGRALPDSRRQSVRFTTRKPADPVPAADLADARIIVVTAPLPATVADSLHARMQAGQTVLFAPGAANAADTFARLLALPAFPLAEERPTRYALLGSLDFQHPILAAFADPRFSDFTRIHFWRYRKILAPLPDSARVLARFDSTDPAWVEFPVGSGRLLFAASGWSTDDSQFALSSKFIPWLYAVLDLAGTSTAPPLHPLVGDPVALPTGRTTAFPVQLPDGSSVEVEPGTASFSKTDQPGIYRFGSGSNAFTVAVNLDPTEGRTTPLSPEQLENLGVRLDAALSSTANPSFVPAAVPPAVEAESRQKLWRWLIAAALAVLVIESLIAGRATRQQSVPQEAIP